MKSSVISLLVCLLRLGVDAQVALIAGNGETHKNQLSGIPEKGEVENEAGGTFNAADIEEMLSTKTKTRDLGKLFVFDMTQFRLHFPLSLTFSSGPF